MITDSIARSQLNRFKSLSGGKSITQDAITEWLRTARTTARNDAHLMAAVTSWVDIHPFPPAPAELRATIEATAIHAAASGRNDCPTCEGNGRRSYWALITVERWEDSGRIKRRTCEEIPCTGDPNYWLMHEPELAARVDQRTQRVALLCGYCDCLKGQTLRRDQSAAMRSDQP